VKTHFRAPRNLLESEGASPPAKPQGDEAQATQAQAHVVICHGPVVLGYALNDQEQHPEHEAQSLTVAIHVKNQIEDVTSRQHPRSEHTLLGIGQNR
jgi:hypothetical protein